MEVFKAPSSLVFSVEHNGNKTQVIFSCTDLSTSPSALGQIFGTSSKSWLFVPPRQMFDIWLQANTPGLEKEEAELGQLHLLLQLYDLQKHRLQILLQQILLDIVDEGDKVAHYGDPG